MNIFSELKNISQPGIYILKNEANKSCKIGYSSNMGLVLVRNINLVTDDYTFEVLEIVTDKKNLRPRCQFWMDNYSNQGYNLVNKRVSSLKLRIDVLRDFRVKGSQDLLFYVKLVSKGYKSVTVGVFSRYSDAEEFVAQNYSNGLVYQIVTADNELTREFLNVHVKEHN